MSTLEITPEVPSRKGCRMNAKRQSVILLSVVVLLLIVAFYFIWSKGSKGSKVTNPQALLVQTKLGAIRGHYLTSYNGNQYEAYQGIPFALPPIGERRFKSPVPIGPWSTELQATKMKGLCLQDVSTVAAEGSEDCLYLDIYVPPKKKINGTLPVIFYIHDGFLRYGGPRETEEMYIMDYDVIFVSSRYRLGVLGFLSTEDHVVPGNMGLKDQATALRWIYDNIEAFGGDSKRVTLFGGNAGGVSTHFHYLSAWSRGLFHTGMSFSGTAFVPWAMVEHSREKTRALAHIVSCSLENIEQMIECMRATPGNTLVAAQNKLQMWWNTNYGVFGPVVENASSSVDPFIDDYPSQILKNGRAYDVPWTTSFLPGEGLLLTSAYTNDTLKYMDEHWDSLAPIILDYTYTIPKEQHVNVARRIRKHYFGEKPINRKNFQELSNLISDRLFIVGITNAAKVQAAVNKSPVFSYYYTYRANYSMSIIYSNNTEDYGVCHSDDLAIVSNDPTTTSAKSDKDMIMQKILIKMWISVAYNRVPDIGVKWPNINLKNKTCLDYMHLAGPDDYKLECSDTLAENKFWNSIGFDEK